MERYSYCLNHPLRYTDPSGELFGTSDAILAFAAFTFTAFNMASSMMQAAATGNNVCEALGFVIKKNIS